MKRFLTGTLAAATLAIGFAGTAAFALPGATNLERPENLVEKTWGCHRSCEFGGARGWHRHVGAACVPVACYPRAVQPNRCWVDWRGVRHCRW